MFWILHRIGFGVFYVGFLTWVSLAVGMGMDTPNGLYVAWGVSFVLLSLLASPLSWFLIVSGLIDLRRLIASSECHREVR